MARLAYQAGRLLIVITVLVQSCEVASIFPWNDVWKNLLEQVYGPFDPASFLTSSDPLILKSVGEVIDYNGYPFESHSIVTEDGYILGLQRIPHGKNNTASTKREPVLLVPGLFSDSILYVGNGQENSLGFILADAGYDVWLHNNRGTRYSRKHVKFSPDEQKEYWDFSYHEMGISDLPAAIDYILSITKAKQVNLVGMSMGGTITAIFLAERPSYEKKVKTAFLLAPAIYMGNTGWKMARHITFLETIFRLCEDMELLPYNENFEKLVAVVRIQRPVVFKVILKSFLEIPEEKFQAQNLLSQNLEKSCSGSSIKLIRHFIQAVQRHSFERYDYGPEINLEKYNQTYPPQYKLGNIKVPVSIYYGIGDKTVNWADILRASKELKSLSHLTRVADDTFDHLDFTLSPNVKELIYDALLDEMRSEEKTTSTRTTSQTEYLQYFVVFSLLVMIIGLLILLIYYASKELIFYCKPRMNESTHLIKQQGVLSD